MEERHACDQSPTTILNWMIFILPRFGLNSWLVRGCIYRACLLTSHLADLLPNKGRT
jgi:hypothetical protein